MSTLELRALRKSFGTTDVIHGVDLHVADGEFVVFVGPSGCGRSTLLRLIAGLDSPTQGDILMDGQSVNAIGAADRGCAMVFQSYALYPHMTVYDNMAFGLQNAGEPADAIDAKVKAAAAQLRLDALLQRRPTQLSGGQRQRVAIGRAIVRHPKIFLFDEPLSNLDAELRVSMRSELRELHRRLQATLIYVTHDQVEAMTLADKIVVLRAGRIEQIGTPEQLYQKPCNPFVAGFIGSPRMNLLPATVMARAPALARLVPPAAALVGVRPEHWHWCADTEGLRLRIQSCEYLGGERLVRGLLDDDSLVELRTTVERAYGMGEVSYIATTPQHLHLFDAHDHRLESPKP